MSRFDSWDLYNRRNGIRQTPVNWESAKMDGYLIICQAILHNARRSRVRALVWCMNAETERLENGDQEYMTGINGRSAVRRDVLVINRIRENYHIGMHYRYKMLRAPWTRVASAEPVTNNGIGMGGHGKSKSWTSNFVYSECHNLYSLYTRWQLYEHNERLVLISVLQMLRSQMFTSYIFSDICIYH